MVEEAAKNKGSSKSAGSLFGLFKSKTTETTQGHADDTNVQSIPAPDVAWAKLDADNVKLALERLVTSADYTFLKCVLDILKAATYENPFKETHDEDASVEDSKEDFQVPNSLIGSALRILWALLYYQNHRSESFAGSLEPDMPEDDESATGLMFKNYIRFTQSYVC